MARFASGRKEGTNAKELNGNPEQGRAAGCVLWAWASSQQEVRLVVSLCFTETGERERAAAGAAADDDGY